VENVREGARTAGFEKKRAKKTLLGAMKGNNRYPMERGKTGKPPPTAFISRGPD